MGEGAFGKVYKAINKISNSIRAIKCINKYQMEEDEKVKLKKEVEIMKNLVIYKLT